MPTSATGPASLIGDIASFRAALEAPVATEADLSARIASVYTALHDIDFKLYNLQDHRADAPEIMRALFETRVGLRDRLADWHVRGLMTRPVQKAVRDVFRAARYASDILGEVWIGHDRLPEGGETYRAFTGPHNNSLLAPRFQTGQTSLPFRSGDVILVRGRLHNSAAIARIGDVDSQFSHVAMVYVDPKGEHWAVEALIEDGSVIVPLREVLHHGIGRAVLFRHKDAALAQRAATIIHDRIRHSRSTFGRPILYDFTMEIDEKARNLFCSKLVRRAYKEASEGGVLLPTFPTAIELKNRDFPDRIGVTATTTFAPGDMELETQFEIVAEWQDYRVTSDLRLQDLVMDKLFEWMERENYRFHETFKIRLISLLGRASSYLSEDIKEIIEDVVPKVPVNMSRRAVAAIAMLHGTAQPLFEEMRKIESLRVRMTGLPMHPREVRAELERLKATMGNEIGYLRRPS